MGVNMVYHAKIVYCLFFLILPVLYTMNIECHEKFLAHKELFHMLVFIWEDMRRLTHEFNTDDRTYELFDEVADKLMILHELILKQIATLDKIQCEDIETECMQTATDIVYITYMLSELSANHLVLQLHTHTQALHKAIAYNLYR